MKECPVMRVEIMFENPGGQKFNKHLIPSCWGKGKRLCDSQQLGSLEFRQRWREGIQGS